MIQDPISELIHLLHLQLDEPETSSTRVQIKSLTDELVNNHKNSRAITLVMNEWNEMFSFQPGRD